MSELVDGVNVKAIFCSDSSHVIVGIDDVESMVIIEEAGSGAMVPWVRVKSKHNSVMMFNCDKLQAVVLLDEKGKD